LARLQPFFLGTFFTAPFLHNFQYPHNIIVGAGALNSPLEATRFELSGICAEQHCADNINKIADEMSRGRDGHFTPYIAA